MAGVCPLVCAVCEQIVGVINEPALAKMLGAEEIYICHGCEERDDVEIVLGTQPPDHYAMLASRVLVGQLLETPVSVNVYG